MAVSLDVECIVYEELFKNQPYYTKAHRVNG